MSFELMRSKTSVCNWTSYLDELLILSKALHAVLHGTQR